MSKLFGKAPSGSSADGFGTTGNSFLDSLPQATRARMLTLCEERATRNGLEIGRPDEPFADVIFPIKSVVSTVLLMVEGSTVEVGLTGHEGLAPIPIAFGSRSSHHSTMVQVPSSAYFMKTDAFLAEVQGDEHLRERCARFAEYSFVASTQFIACNALHPVEERYARWILMASDRVGSRDFELTQEFSAQMLGVRRATVTNIALSLAKNGFISYRRGHVSILDRESLEDAACECYAAINVDLQRLMGYGARRPDATTL